MAAEELRSAFAQNRQDITWLALRPDERVQLLAQVQDAIDHAGQLETQLRNTTNMAVNQNVTLASTQREAARAAKVLADLRKAEADRAARAASRAAAARKAQADALEESRSRAAAAKERREKERRRADQRSGDSDSDSSSRSRSDDDRSSSSRGD
jgi:RecA-family ATPase